MEKLEAFERYKLFLAYRMHFASPSYDLFKYKGNVRATPMSYLRHASKWRFEELWRMFPNRNDLMNYLISAFMYNKKYYIKDVLNNKQLLAYHFERLERFNNLDKVFENDCTIIGEYLEANNKNVKDLVLFEGAYPLYIKLYLHKDIQLETVCILEQIFRLAPQVKDKYAFADVYNLIIKYTPFLNVQNKLRKYSETLKNKTNKNN